MIDLSADVISIPMAILGFAAVLFVGVVAIWLVIAFWLAKPTSYRDLEP